MTRADALGRYRALPLPTTKDEHWRFTNLAGFDPDAWSADGATQIASPPTMLELDASGIAYVGEAGIDIVSAPDGIRFEPLSEDHEDWPAPREEEEVSDEDRERIETLFQAAHGDRSKAVELKALLDRLGHFKRYENRFLDLFKKAE